MKTMAVLIGRMQPPHKGHAHLIKTMVEDNDHVTILLGSSLRTRDIKNPFRWQKRAAMAAELVAEFTGWDFEFADNRNGGCHCLYRDFPNGKWVSFYPLQDHPYNNRAWQEQVQGLVHARQIANGVQDEGVRLYGNFKDASSWYLNTFTWPRVEIPFYKPHGKMLNATDVRELLYDGWDHYPLIVGKTTTKHLNQWRDTDEGRRLIDEYHVLQAYKSKFAGLEYPPIFQTVDNVVLWRGKVLLGRRRSAPAKGLWALPGGFVNADETLQTAALREFAEESNTRVYATFGTKRKRLQFDPNWLHARKTFDDPNRSQRGRTITTAFLWVIPDRYEVEHEAGDDLSKTRWFTMHDIKHSMHYDLMEDHQQIITTMLQRGDFV